MTAPAVTRGDRFEHARQIDGSPKAGTARPVVMVVTAVTRRAIYYRREDATATGAAWYSTPAAFESVVGRWLP